jgi:hypothetical protein
MSDARPPDRPAQMSSRVRTPLIIAGVLLGIAIVVPLLVPTYAREDPKLWGFPFFYWYQLLWVFICAALVVGAHRLVRQHEERKREEVGLGRHRDETGGDR